MYLTYKYWHGATDVASLSVYELSIYNRTSSWLIAINKLQRFICDKKQNSGIEISYNDKCFIQNCNENNMSPSVRKFIKLGLNVHGTNSLWLTEKI